MLLQIFSWFWQWTSFENRLLFDEIKAYKESVPIFLATLYIGLYWGLPQERYTDQHAGAYPVFRTCLYAICTCPYLTVYKLNYNNYSRDIYSAPVGERSTAISLYLSLSVCLSASISPEPQHRSSRNFVYRSPVAMARSSYGGVAIRYVLPVLWIMSRLAVMDRIAMRGRPTTSGVAIPQDIVWFCHKTRVWQTDGRTDGQNYDQDRATIG